MGRQIGTVLGVAALIAALATLNPNEPLVAFRHGVLLIIGFFAAAGVMAAVFLRPPVEATPPPPPGGARDGGVGGELLDPTVARSRSLSADQP